MVQCEAAARPRRPPSPGRERLATRTCSHWRPRPPQRSRRTLGRTLGPLRDPSQLTRAPCPARNHARAEGVALAPREGIEPPTPCLEGRCSIRLSYRGARERLATGVARFDTPMPP